jgi:hypothetical protein
MSEVGTTHRSECCHYVHDILPKGPRSHFEALKYTMNTYDAQCKTDPLTLFLAHIILAPNLLLTTLQNTTQRQDCVFTACSGKACVSRSQMCSKILKGNSPSAPHRKYKVLRGLCQVRRANIV